MPSKNRGIAFNVPYLALLAFILAGGQLLYLKYFSFPTALELGLLALVILTQTLALLLALATVLGLVIPKLGARTRDLSLSVLLLLSCFVFVDFLSFGWLSLHLTDTFPMLVWCLRTDFLVMADKRVYLIPAAFGAVALLALGFALARRSGRSPWGAVPVSGKKLGVLWAAALVLLGAGQGAAAYGLRPQIAVRQREVLWQLPLVATGSRPLKKWDDPQFPHLPEEAAIQKKLAAGPKGTGSHPDIYLFIVESFRADAVTADLAPHLARLASDSLPIQRALAAANCTHISWNALLTGFSPLHWRLPLAARTKPGSIPVRLLKRLGYDVNVLSTPSMEYFGAGETFFGKPPLATIADQSELLKDAGKDDIAALDEAAGKRLVAAASRQRAGAPLFQVVFLDSTHHHYYWPDSFKPKYLPVGSESMELFRTSYRPDEVESLHNRYRNAVAFLDELIGGFVTALEKSNRLEDSIIIVTGDHGEEFNERGNLVHASELNRFQTLVPLIIHVPKAMKGRSPASIALASHSDLFPTLFDLMGESEMAAGLFQGHSLLGPGPELPLVAECASETPRYFILDRGADKALFELEAPWGRGLEIHARSLRLTELRGADDEPLFPRADQRNAALAHWEAHYAKAFSSLFASPQNAIP